MISSKEKRGRLKTLKYLIKIDKECKMNDELRIRLEPIVNEMNGEPHNMDLVDKFICEYERLKNELETGKVK